MRRGSSVQGINSAATLWATASMGLAIGAGYYSLGLLVLLVVLGIQFSVRWLANFIDARSGFLTPSASYKVIVDLTPAASERIRSAWSSFASRPGVSTVHYHELQKDTSGLLIEAEVGLSEVQVKQLTRLIQGFSQTEGVSRAEWTELKATDSD